jgi:hypothetical protein
MLVAQTDRVLPALESVFGMDIYDYLVEALPGFSLERREVVGG